MFGEAGKAGWGVWSQPGIKRAPPPSADEKEKIKNKSPPALLVLFLPPFLQDLVLSLDFLIYNGAHPWPSEEIFLLEIFLSQGITDSFSCIPWATFSSLAGAFLGKLVNPGVQIPAGVGFVWRKVSESLDELCSWKGEIISLQEPLPKISMPLISLQL